MRFNTQSRLLPPAVLGVLLCGFVWGAASKTHAKTVRLSQRKAVGRALGRHPAIRAVRKAVQAATARVEQTRTAWYPRIKLEASYMLIGPVQKLSVDTGFTIPGEDQPVTIEQEMGSLHNAGAGVSVAWRAYDFGARSVRTDAANALKKAVRAQTQTQRSSIAHAVRMAYLAARFFKEVEKSTRGSLTVAQADRKQKQKLHTAGVGNKLDVARVDMRIAELSSRLAQAVQQRNKALTTLRILLGFPADTQLVLTDGLQQLGTTAVPQNGRTPHPLRQRLEALHTAAELEHKRLGRTYWPTLDLVGSFKYQYPKNYFESDIWGMQYTAGVVLTWKVFDGDLRRRQRNESEAKIAELAAKREAVDEEIQRKLAAARAKVKIADAGVTAAQKRIRAAKVYLAAARAARKGGTGTGLEVKKARDSLDQAQLSLIKAYFDGAAARAEILHVLGRAKDEKNARTTQKARDTRLKP